MPNIGPLELIVVLVIVLLIVGPKKLPGLGRSLGTGMREFKDSVTGNDKEPSVIEAPRDTPAVTPDPLAKAPAEPAPQPRDAD